MLIGACGLRWDRDVYQWNRVAKRRLLGQRPAARGRVTVADFSTGRGLYVLHSSQGIYYVGLTRSYGMLTGRISDHTKDDHSLNWDRFSWCSFDAPSDRKDEEGVLLLDSDWDHYGDDLTAEAAIKDLEAIMIAALAPPGNKKIEKFGEALVWEQVANIEKPRINTLSEIQGNIA